MYQQQSAFKCSRFGISGNCIADGAVPNLPDPEQFTLEFTAVGF